MRMISMRWGVAAAALLVAPMMANAADIPMKAPPYEPAAPVPYYDWSGFYLGGHVGYGWGATRWNFVSSVGPVTDRASQNVNHNINGWLAGVHGGFNYQMGQWVVGAEASWSGANIDGRRRSTFGAADDVYTTSVGSIFQLAARLGVAWDRSLIYLKGGYANARVRVTTTDNVGINTGTAASSRRHNGYVLGVGWEYLVTPNLVLGVEYDYLNLAGRRHRQAFSGAGGNTVDNVTAHVHSIMARASYKFGLGPVGP